VAESAFLSTPELYQLHSELGLETFWACIFHSDNATHFKSSSNLFRWSGLRDELRKLRDFIKTIRIEFGCPGHGKGPWDGLGAVVKTIVRNAIINQKCLTSSRQIACAREVAEHLRRAVCTPEWMSRHRGAGINEVVVFYIDELVMNKLFPRVEPVYSTLKGISSAYSFMVLGGEGRVASRPWSCWCNACCVGFQSERCEEGLHCTAGCARGELTRFSHHRINCTQASGIANARERAKELVLGLMQELKAGEFAAVQARERWSSEESIHLRPGHYWLFELGDAGQGSPVSKTFDKREMFRGIRFDANECAIRVKRWLNRTADDLEGLTFVEWQEADQDVMIVNSSELRAVGFTLEQIRDQSQQPAGARRPSAGTRGAGARLAQQRVDPSLKYRLSSTDDAVIRARCDGS
jgi:hypothetical protein